MRKREPRIRAVVPLKLVGKDCSDAEFTSLICTLDLSKLGLRATSLDRELAVGSEVTLQYKHRKVLYRVVWCRRTGKSGRNYHIGFRCVDPTANTWTLLGQAGGAIEATVRLGSLGVFSQHQATRPV